MICVIHRWFMVNQRNPDSCLPSVVCSWVWIPPSKSSTLKDLANDKTSLQQLEAAGSRGFCWWTTKYWKDLEIHSRLFWDNDINWLTNNEYQLYHNWKYIPWHYNWFWSHWDILPIIHIGHYISHDTIILPDYITSTLDRKNFGSSAGELLPGGWWLPGSGKQYIYIWTILGAMNNYLWWQYIYMAVCQNLVPL